MDIAMCVGVVMAGMFGILMSGYLALCLICWISDVIENKKRRWKK